MNGKKIFGLILIILAVLLHFITAWPWWIKLVILVIGIIMLLCKGKECCSTDKKPAEEEKVEEAPVETPTEEATPEVEEEKEEVVI